MYRRLGIIKALMATIVNEKEIIQEKAEIAAEPFNLMKFLHEVRTEFIKITWPSREQVAREFISVVLLVFVITGIIFLLDKIFETIVNFFNGRLFSDKLKNAKSKTSTKSTN